MSAARFSHVVRSEWTKLRTLRSTPYSLLAAGVLAVGLSLLISNGAGRDYAGLSDAERAEFDPTQAGLQSFIVVQLALSVFGVLVVTSEYATGMVRTSLTAVPRRGRLLAAKGLVFGVVALVVGQVAGFGAFLAGQAMLAGAGAPRASLGEPAVLRAVVGCGLYLALIGLLGVAVGVLVRATAGAVMIMVAVTLLVPALTPVLPEALAKAVGKFGPFGAGVRMMAVPADPNLLTPWAGFGVLCLWVATALTVAAVVFHRRDA